MFPNTFDTNRLRFERLSRENISPLDLYEVASDRNPTVEEEFQYLPQTPTKSAKQAADRIDSYEQDWESAERADWLIIPKEGEDSGGQVAGRAGLICQWEKDLAMPTIWLRKPFWGRGYSGERADALLEIAFERLDFGVVAIPLHCDNDKSYRAVEKYISRYGGQYEGLLRHHAGRYDDPVNHHRFSISQTEYRASK